LPGVNIIAEDKKYITPLHLACKYGFDEAAELLIEKIDPEKLINPSSNLDFR
jgi:ankyrin repeat protein